MRKIVLVVSALVATSPAVAGPPAAGPNGVTCGVVSVTDGGAGPGVQTGIAYGGPLVGDGTLTCTVQDARSTHGATHGTPSAMSGTGAVAVPPTHMSYLRSPDVGVWVCTEWDPAGAGPTLYWDSPRGLWTPDPTAECALASSVSSDDLSWTLLADYVHPAVCPTLATLLPPQGDVPGIGWDCPPYASRQPTDAVWRTPDVYSAG